MQELLLLGLLQAKVVFENYVFDKTGMRGNVQRDDRSSGGSMSYFSSFVDQSSSY